MKNSTPLAGWSFPPLSIKLYGVLKDSNNFHPLPEVRNMQVGLRLLLLFDPTIPTEWH
ncbi:hypothetical protein [Nostoc sp.]|uniref:hypothetical protein n=1 Tax=Nostoc sp. TaxID=1180 RepID=UPI002FEF734A